MVWVSPAALLKPVSGFVGGGGSFGFGGGFGGVGEGVGGGLDSRCFERQTRAHGNVRVPGNNLDAHEARGDGGGEPDFNLFFGVADKRVADKRGAVRDVRERSVRAIAGQNLERRDVLVRVPASLQNDGGNRANFAGVHGQGLAGAVLRRRPAAGTVEHAHEVARTGLVVAIHA